MHVPSELNLSVMSCMPLHKLCNIHLALRTYLMTIGIVLGIPASEIATKITLGLNDKDLHGPQPGCCDVM
jgi:hypothetical protein